MIAPDQNPSPHARHGLVEVSGQAIWASFSSELGSILVVGHGTRNPNGAKQLMDMVCQMQSTAPFANISGCFLELSEPSIQQAMEQLHQQGIRKALIVPVLLFTAAHAMQDIPEAVNQAAKRYGIKVIGQTNSLGTHHSVIGLSHARYGEVTSLCDGVRCPDNACARVQCSSGICDGQLTTMGRIGLAMVGRGTSDQRALAHMRQLTELKVAQLSTVRYQTGFFAGGKPNVDELLEEASGWECDTVVVQPHLLFEGELIQQLRSKVLQCQLSFPGKQWLVARTLGADRMLADVFLDLAREHLIRNTNEA